MVSATEGYIILDIFSGSDEEFFFEAVEKAGLMSEAWTGLKFSDLPEEVQEQISKVVEEVKERFDTHDSYDSYDL
jgi:hypothetical protein